jgi:hypothetical protein
MKTPTEESPVEESIRMYLKNEIDKIGARGGFQIVANELGIHPPTLSKIIARQQRISKNVIDKILEKKGFSTIEDLLEYVKERQLVSDPVTLTNNQDDETLSIGLGFAMGSLPLFLAIKKSDYLKKKINIYVSHDDNKTPVLFKNNLLENPVGIESYDFFKDKLSITERQNLLSEGFLDCIFLPELSVDYSFDLLPVCRIGGADLVISLIGEFDDTDNLDEKSEKEYLPKEQFTSFLAGKKIKLVYTQNKLIKELYESLLRQEDLKDYFPDDKSKILHHESEDHSNKDVIEKILEKGKTLNKNELIAIIGYAPLPVHIQHKFLEKQPERNSKHLAFNFSKIIGLNRMSFDLFVSKKIFDNKTKLRLLHLLINEIKYACDEIHEYKEIFEKETTFKVDIESLLKIPEYNDPQFSKKTVQNNNFYFLDSLHHIYYPNFKNQEHPEALFRRAVINHLSFDMSTNEPVFTYVFTQLALKMLSEN